MPAGILTETSAIMSISQHTDGPIRASLAPLAVRKNSRGGAGIDIDPILSAASADCPFTSGTAETPSKLDRDRLIVLDRF